MKALTLTCPWAHAVAHWGKNIENRTWQPPRELFGQRLAIHAGKSPYGERKRGGWGLSENARAELAETQDFIVEAMRDSGIEITMRSGRWLHESSSAILCVATVAGWVRESGEYDIVTKPGQWEPATMRDKAIESAWFVGPYGWVLSDVVTLATPVPCKGAQGLWTLPPDVEAAVMGQFKRTEAGR